MWIQNAQDCISIDTSWKDSEDAEQNTPLLDMNPGHTQGNIKGNMKGNTTKSTRDNRTKENDQYVSIKIAQDCISMDTSWNNSKDAHQNTTLLNTIPDNNRGNTKGNMKENVTKIHVISSMKENQETNQNL